MNRELTEFHCTTPEAFQYLVGRIKNSDELLHSLDKEGRSAADIAVKNTELYKYLINKMKVYPEKNETLNYRRLGTMILGCVT